MSPARKKVFISYSHDSPQHEERVLQLAYRLNDDGIAVGFDRFVNPPPANWPRWMEEQLDSSDYVVVVCSQNYSAKVHGKVKKGTGKGVKWESLISTQQIYDNDSDSARFIPVLLEGGEYEHIPQPMRGGNHYRLDQDGEYEKLFRHITDQPATPQPVPGPVRKLDPLPRPGTKTAAGAKPAHAAKTATSPLLNVPPRNGVFTGRESILSDLRADLAQRGWQALFGLGGVGKTQIATEYAYRHQGDYTAVLWTFAGTEQSVRAGFATIAAQLDLPEKESAEQSRVVEAVRRWLEQNPGWLLVLDNADDPAMVRPFLPQLGQGHVLLTSRAHAFQAVGIFSPREIEVLLSDEAREFLLRRTGKDPTANSPEAEALAKELGYLPLALEQAAAYITETQASFATYLAAFQKRRLKVLEKAGPVLGNDEREQQKRTVATTWALNFADVEKQSAASADLLRLSAFLAPDAIPLELLEKGGRKLPEALAAKLAEAAENPLAVDELLSPLLRFSFIRRDEEKRTYSVHPLVQEVVRDGLDNEKQKAWAETAVRTVSASFPDVVYKKWAQCERLLSHALVCAALIQTWGMESLEASRLLTWAGIYLKKRAEYSQAQQLYQQALTMDEKALGEEHPDTAASLNNLGRVLEDQGKPEEAEPLYRRALAIYEKKFGPDHPSTATILNNIAGVLKDQEKPEEAELLYRRALTIREKALPSEHPEIAISLNDLAILLGDQGKFGEAEPLFRRALAIYEKAWGLEHPDTASSLNNLAGCLRRQGKLEEAEPLYRGALAMSQKMLGAEHPYTISSLNNLANFLDHQGKPDEAEPLFRRALAIFTTVLGEEHPRTVTVRKNLVHFYRKQGRKADADALEKEMHS